MWRQPDTAVVTSPELLDALIHDSDGALKLLSDAGAPVELGDISIDNYGRVVIANADFAQAIVAGQSDELASAKNIICAVGGVCGIPAASIDS